MWGIFGMLLGRAIQSCLVLGGGLEPCFFKNRPLPLTVGFFLPVLVQFQTDCTTPLLPVLHHMSISGSHQSGGFLAFDV